MIYVVVEVKVHDRKPLTAWASRSAAVSEMERLRTLPVDNQHVCFNFVEIPFEDGNRQALVQALRTHDKQQEQVADLLRRMEQERKE